VGSLGLTVLETVVVGVVLNFTTQTGDLVESLLKRRCGAKDSSHLLPAHGGVLDLIDSLLFSFTAWFLVLVYKT
jgi:phosphatidate cytidylyltransferase